MKCELCDYPSEMPAETEELVHLVLPKSFYRKMQAISDKNHYDIRTFIGVALAEYVSKELSE
jgi:hypothetical protein